MQGHDHSAIGTRAQVRRKQLGLTVAEVAARVGFSVGRVYNFECYGAGTIDLVERWARALEMDPRELAFGPLPTPRQLTPAEELADDAQYRERLDRWKLRQLAP